MAADLTGAIQARIHRTNYVLTLIDVPCGSFYMNSVAISRPQLKYLDRFFPINSSNLLRLGLNIGSLMSYSVTSVAKLHTFINYMTSILESSSLVDEIMLGDLYNSLDMAMTKELQQQRSISQIEAPTESPKISPKIKSSRSIGDLSRLLNTKEKQKENQKENQKEKLHNEKPQIEKTVRKQKSSMRMALKRMKSSQSLLWGGSSAGASGAGNDYPASNSMTSSASNGALHSPKPSNYRHTPQLPSSQSHNNLYSSNSLPIVAPLDNLYALSNVLKLLIKSLEKIQAFVADSELAPPKTQFQASFNNSLTSLTSNSSSSLSRESQNVGSPTTTKTSVSSRAPKKRTEEEAATLQLYKELDHVLRKQLFEPVFEALDIVGEKLIGQQLTEISDLLGGL